MSENGAGYNESGWGNGYIQQKFNSDVYPFFFPWLHSYPFIHFSGLDFRLPKLLPNFIHSTLGKAFAGLTESAVSTFVLFIKFKNFLFF